MAVALCTRRASHHAKILRKLDGWLQKLRTRERTAWQKLRTSLYSRHMSLNDDHGVGRILTRREVLAFFGAAGAAGAGALFWRPDLAAAQAAPCVVVPEQMEGPYFVEEKLNRIDIRTDPGNGQVRLGTQLDVALRVSRMAASGGCAPLAGAVVDVWQCDAAGLYSDVRDTQVKFDTRGQKFLRGHQVTDAQGLARFTTIYPGWYPGRAVHIHFKIRTNPSGARGEDFTSQLYFDEALTDKVHAQQPYAAKGRRNMTNEKDGIYRNGGKQLMLNLSEKGGGYAGMFDVALKI
jgi:protocatechuate 3,4-dioxygenase beta subunit